MNCDKLGSVSRKRNRSNKITRSKSSSDTILQVEITGQLFVDGESEIIPDLDLVVPGLLSLWIASKS